MRFLKNALYAAALFFPPRNAASILLYHSISGARHFASVTPENFERQMEALKRRGFNVVSLDALARMREAGRIPPKTVCITFDDGYRDNYAVAFPILKRLGFPATVFVITDVIGATWEARGETFDMLSETEIRELSRSGLVAIEPHTASHPKLHYLPPADAEREVRISKERLESITGKACAHFAYPKGGHNSQVREAVQRAGIKHAYTVEAGFVRAGDDDLRLRRNGISRAVTLPQFLGIAVRGRLSRSRILSLLGI